MRCLCTSVSSTPKSQYVISGMLLVVVVVVVVVISIDVFTVVTTAAVNVIANGTRACVSGIK